MVITEIKHLNVRISQFEDNIFDKNILPIFTTPLILKEVDARKKSRYKIETLNPEKKLTFKIVSFNKIVEELAARINQIAIDLEPHYFIDPTYFNSLPYNVRQFLDKKNLIDETKEIEEALLRVKRSTVKNKKLILYANFILASRLFLRSSSTNDAQYTKGIAQRNQNNSPKSQKEAQGLRRLGHKQIENKKYGANILTMSLFRDNNKTLLLKKKNILKYRVETLINFKKFNLASLLKEQSMTKKSRSAAATLISGWIPTSKGALMLLEDEGWDLNLLSNINKTAQRSSSASQRLKKRRPYSLRKLRRLRRLRRSRLMSINLYLHRSKNVKTIQKDQITQGRNHSKLNNEYLIKHNDNKLKFIINWIGDNLSLPSTAQKPAGWTSIRQANNAGQTQLPTQISSSYLQPCSLAVQRLNKKNIPEIFLAQYSKPLRLSTIEIGAANPNLYSSKSANSNTLSFYSKPKQGCVAADLHLQNVNKEGAQSTTLLTANKTRQLTQGGAQYRFSFLTKEQDRNHIAKNRKFTTLASSNFNISNVKKIVQLNTLNLSRAASNDAKKGPDSFSLSDSNISGNKKSPKYKKVSLDNSASANVSERKAQVNQARFNLLNTISSNKKKEKLSTQSALPALARAERNTNISLLSQIRIKQGMADVRNTQSENKKVAFIYDSQINNTSKNLRLIESKLINWQKKKKFLEVLLHKTSQNFANSLILRKKIYLASLPQSRAERSAENLKRNIKQSHPSAASAVTEKKSRSNLAFNLKLKFLNKIKSSVEPAYLPWEKASIALLLKLKSNPRLFWALINLYSSSFNPMLKSLNKGGVNSAISLRLSGFSNYRAAQIKKLKKTAPTIQTFTDPSVSSLRKGTAVLDTTQQYGAQTLNLKQENKIKSLPLHTVNLLIYQLNRKLETISQHKFSKGNTTKRRKQKGGTIINASQLERIAKIKEQILVLSSKGIAQSSKAKHDKLGVLTQASITPAQGTLRSSERNQSSNLTLLQAPTGNTELKFKKGSGSDARTNLNQVLFKQIDNILAFSGKSKTLPSILESKAEALAPYTEAKERNSDNKRFLFLYFIIPIFFATLKLNTATPNSQLDLRRQIILKNQKKQLHSLIKLMLSAGSVIRNKKKINLFSAHQDVRQPASVRDAADLLKWSILFIAHSLAPLKRKQEYYSLIFIKILEAKGILTPIKNKVHSKLNVKSPRIYPTNLERLAARYHGSPFQISTLTKEDLIYLIANSNPDFNLERLINGTAQIKEGVYEYVTEIPSRKTGTSQAVINKKKTFNSNTASQEKAPQLQLLTQKWRINSLSVVKEAQGLHQTKGKEDVNKSSLKINENNQHFQPKIRMEKGKGDKPLLQTEGVAEKASITFYPGGRFLSDWKRVTKVIWQEELKFKAIYSRVNNSLSKVAKAEQGLSKENLPKQIASQMINSLKLNTDLKKSFNNLVFAKSTIIGKIRSIKLIELIDKMKEEIIIAEKLAALERVADITNLNLINKKQFRRINATKYLNKKNIYRTNRIKILQTIKTIKTDLRFEPKLDSNSLSIIPVSLLYYSNLKEEMGFKHKKSALVQVNSPVASAEGVAEKPPVLNAYLRDLSPYNRETKGTIKYYSKIIGYNFNTNTNKISNNIYDLLAASFKAMRCLISKPVFVITPDKITIQLFYFLLVASKPRLIKVKKRLKYSKNNRLRLRKIYKKARLYQAKNFDLFSLNKLFPKQFDLLCNILNKEFNKPVELNLTRLHYPSGDSNILVNLVGLIIHKVRTQRIFKKIFAGSIIKTLIKLKARKFNDISIIPAFLTGLNIRIAGRLMTQPMRPRKTINQIRRGASASGKINYLNFARLTKKNKRGSFSITISAGQNYFK